LSEVREAVVAENVEIPGGAVEQGKGQLLLRTMGRIDAAEDFNNIVVASKNGTPIRVSDIGHAEDSFERPTSSVWSGDQPAVILDIRRAMGENTVDVIEGVRSRLASIQRTLPNTVKMSVVRDDSKFIYASVESLEEHLIFGSLFAAIVVMFFIRNIRAVIIAALAIPASLIASFTLMRMMGFTLNNMTLLGITLAVGIVIDDAIVVLENIFRYIEEKDCTPFEAAIQGTREVALAVMATTLSLVVIFLPIAFMNGYAKRFINPFGWTMAFSIMVSMLVSFTLTPMLSSRFLKLSDAVADHKTKERGFFHWLDVTYERQVKWALDHSGVIIAVSVITALMTFPLNRIVGREFVPNEDMGEWTIHMDAPEGTSLEGSQEIAFSVLKELEGIEGVAEIEPMVNPGGSGAAGGGGGSNVTHIHFQVQALPIDQRKHTQSQMITEMRKRLAQHPAYRPSISARNALGSGEGQGGFAISANILGPDLREVADYSMKALAAAQKVPSITEAKISLSVSNPEIHVAVDRRRAADLGVRMATIGNTLRLAVAGDDEISFFKEGQEQYPVKIRVLESQRRDASEIGRLTVPSATGPVRIDNIARVERGLGPSQLQRSNRQFSVMVTADVAPGHALDEAANDFRAMLATLSLPPTMTYRMQGQSKILDETTANLMLAIGLAMIFVYMVLAAQFELPAAGRDHAGAADRGAVRDVHAVDHQPQPEPVERARHAPAARHRQEELDPAGGLRERAARAGRADPRGDHRVVPHSSAADSDDHFRDHRRADPDVARPRHRRHRPRGDRGHRDRRPGTVSVPHAAAGSGRLHQVRRAREGRARGSRQGVARQDLRRYVGPAAPAVRDAVVSQARPAAPGASDTSRADVSHKTRASRMTVSAFRRISPASSNGSASWNFGANSSTESEPA
jgi:HAE1 family hydrophobic/amphiphilic exporter-1